MITAESTMMPKATAPSDNRLASSPRSTKMMLAKKSANGIVRADDDGAAQVTQENPLNEENQQTAENQIVQNGMRGQSDQRAAIVIGNNLYSRGQTAIGIQLCDFSLNARNDIVGMLGPPHHDDPCRAIIIVIPPPASTTPALTDPS